MSDLGGGVLLAWAGVRRTRDVFIMKLFASRDRDWDDLIALWPLSGFSDPSEVVTEYYQAYPHEMVDPHLDKQVRRIAKAASV